MMSPEKYFRKVYWNAANRLSAKPLEKYFRRVYWNAVHISWKIVWERYLERSKIESQIVREAYPSIKYFLGTMNDFSVRFL